MTLSRLLARELWGLYNAAWVSLHTDDPGITGANEVPTPRQQLILGQDWSNTKSLTFGDLPEVVGAIRYVGLWSARSGGEFLQGAMLAERKFTNKGGAFVIGSGMLEVEARRQ